MSILSPSASIVKPATMPKSAVMLGRARDPINGRFVASDAPYGLQTVMLPTGIVAYRVGPVGVIYATLATAKRNAAIRRPGYLAPAEPVKTPSPVRWIGYEVPANKSGKRIDAREFGAGLGVEVDADDLRMESSYDDFVAMDAMSSGLAHAYAYA